MLTEYKLSCLVAYILVPSTNDYSHMHVCLAIAAWYGLQQHCYNTKLMHILLQATV
jgi:hypothetical protein